MPRIRTIKPDFFQHEALYDAERESGLPVRIAFAGLWTVADKLGRFEWRPRQIKLNVLPYDDVDFSAVLSALEAHGFVKRYDVEGKSYGYIPSWSKHQHINVREPSSTIPAPDGSDECTGDSPDKAGAGTGVVPAQDAGKGRERKGEGSEHVQARATPGLDLNAWDRWLDYRKSKRKGIGSESAVAAALALAKFGADQAAVVEQSIANGWQGLFDLKRSNGARPDPAEVRRQRGIEASWSRVKAHAQAIGCPLQPAPHESAEVFETRVKLWEREAPSKRTAGPVSVAAVLASKGVA